MAWKVKDKELMNLLVRTGASLLGLFTFSLACDSPDATDLGAGKAEHRTKGYSAGGGPHWGCRDCGFTNSPFLGLHAFESVGYGTVPGASPNKLVEAVDASGSAWPVYVDEYGLGVDKAGDELRGDDLVGWTLIVDATTATGSMTFEVEVYAFEEVPGWDDNEEPVPTYGLSVYDSGTDTMVNVCPGMDVDLTSVVFLDRELYDLSSYGVNEGVDNVASMACRGHAVAKMKLLQYGPSSGTTVEERLATLRMITADYCGDGTSNTVHGTPLDWTDQRGHVMFDENTMSSVVEAEWSEEGALCANTPRLGGPTPVCDGQPLPSCESPFSGSINGDVTWVSMNPPQP